jgi:hypothetical protein
MFLHISNGRLNLIPEHMDCFSHFLRGACPLHLKGTGDFQFTEIFVYSLKEINDGLFLSEHTIQSILCISALKQIDKKRDKEKQDGDQKAECFWLHWDIHSFPPRRWLFVEETSNMMTASTAPWPATTPSCRGGRGASNFYDRQYWCRIGLTLLRFIWSLPHLSSFDTWVATDESVRWDTCAQHRTKMCEPRLRQEGQIRTKTVLVFFSREEICWPSKSDLGKKILSSLGVRV